MANLLLGSVYAGEVVVLRQLASVCALRDASRTLLETALADSDPPTAASRLEPARFLGGCQATCSTVLSPEHQFHQLWTDVITEVLGVEAAADTTWDGCKIRVQPPAPLANHWDSVSLLQNKNPTKSVLPMHRDTWGSSTPSQVNWWTPMYPLDRRRTLELFPKHFELPVPNTSREWRVGEFVKWRASMVAKGAVDDVALFSESPQYASLPEATAKGVEEAEQGGGPAGGAAVPILIEPGDLVLFSAAHLHRSTSNSTDMTRFSTETRTVQRRDFGAGAGAPDVDNGGPTRSTWFRGVHDGEPLA